MPPTQSWYVLYTRPHGEQSGRARMIAISAQQQDKYVPTGSTASRAIAIAGQVSLSSYLT